MVLHINPLAQKLPWVDKRSVLQAHFVYDFLVLAKLIFHCRDDVGMISY
jgi:hypothetical protein